MTEAKDPYTFETAGAPAYYAASVTPDDTARFEFTCRALYIGSQGDLAVTMWDGEDVTFASVPAGTLLPIRCQRVKSTGTTASNIVQLR